MVQIVHLLVVQKMLLMVVWMEKTVDDALDGGSDGTTVDVSENGTDGATVDASEDALDSG